MAYTCFLLPRSPKCIGDPYANAVTERIAATLLLFMARSKGFQKFRRQDVTVRMSYFS